MKQGYMMFVYDGDIDYGSIAVFNARQIKSKLKVNSICLITDEETKSNIIEKFGKEETNRLFEYIEIVEIKEKELNNHRTLSEKRIVWKNATRNVTYDKSPFDETILLDCDYLIYDDSLDKIWNNTEDVLINKEAKSVVYGRVGNGEQHIGITGLPMYWATLVYFKKSEKAKILFDLVNIVKENYQYYQTIYQFPYGSYRNDYVFSIAIHLLNNQTNNEQVKSFPQPYLLTSFDIDDILEVTTDNIKILTKNYDNYAEDLIVNIRNMNVHIMNKESFLEKINEQ